MIFWVIIFIVIVLISLLLSYYSMKDYQLPLDSKLEYGLFLIRKTSNLSLDLLSELLKSLDNNLISFERLFKGGEAALLIYGPKDQLVKLQPDLDLLEMEDYTLNLKVDSLSAWEFGIRADLERKENLFEDFPKLSEAEQFWWQIIIRPLQKDEKVFKGNIRAVVLSDNPDLRRKLVITLQNLASQYLIKLPKAYSNKQIMNFYIERNMSPTKQNLNLRQILKLLKVN